MNENQDNSPSNASPGETHVDSSGASENVNPVTLTLAELNARLGRNYTDKDSALKGLSDTFSFVGKKVETTATAQPQNPSYASAQDVKALQEDLFYSQNPDYVEYRKTIAMMGSNPAEVVNSEAFKILWDKVKVADDASKKKSVVSSSPRLAQTQTVMDEAVKVANATGSAEATADILAKAIRAEMTGR